MEKLTGITLCGEWLGSNVTINAMFRAICAISPIIMKEFIQVVNKIEELDGAVNVDNFKVSGRNSISINFSNLNLFGKVDLNFKVEDNIVVLDNYLLNFVAKNENPENYFTSNDFVENTDIANEDATQSGIELTIFNETKNTVEIGQHNETEISYAAVSENSQEYEIDSNLSNNAVQIAHLSVDNDNNQILDRTETYDKETEICEDRIENNNDTLPKYKNDEPQSTLNQISQVSKNYETENSNIDSNEIVNESNISETNDTNVSQVAKNISERHEVLEDKENFSLQELIKTKAPETSAFTNIDSENNVSDEKYPVTNLDNATSAVDSDIVLNNSTNASDDYVSISLDDAENDVMISKSKSDIPVDFSTDGDTQTYNVHSASVQIFVTKKIVQGYEGAAAPTGGFDNACTGFGSNPCSAQIPPQQDFNYQNPIPASQPMPQMSYSNPQIGYNSPQMGYNSPEAFYNNGFNPMNQPNNIQMVSSPYPNLMPQNFMTPANGMYQQPYPAQPMPQDVNMAQNNGSYSNVQSAPSMQAQMSGTAQPQAQAAQQGMIMQGEHQPTLEEIVEMVENRNREARKVKNNFRIVGGGKRVVANNANIDGVFVAGDKVYKWGETLVLKK